MVLKHLSWQELLGGAENLGVLRQQELLLLALVVLKVLRFLLRDASHVRLLAVVSSVLLHEDALS